MSNRKKAFAICALLATGGLSPAATAEIQPNWLSWVPPGAVVYCDFVTEQYLIDPQSIQMLATVKGHIVPGVGLIVEFHAKN
jgi:hypothetical protein